MIQITTYRSLPDDAVLEAAADVYVEAFSQFPYFETPDERLAFLDRVHRYASRDGFRLATAADGAAVVGIALAVIAVPGDWYRDQLAAQVTRPHVDRWLGDRCLEVVHVAVRPSQEGRGIGARLLAALLDDPGAATGVLTVDPRAQRARRLYASRGWTVVQDNIRIGEGSPVELMARDL